MKISYLGKNFSDCGQIQEYMDKNATRLTDKDKKAGYKILATDFLIRFVIQQAIVSTLSAENEKDKQEMMATIAQALIDADLVPEKEMETRIREALEEIQTLETELGETETEETTLKDSLREKDA